MAKYRHLRQRVLDRGFVAPENLHVPPAATDEDLLRVHDAAYLEQVLRGTLDRRAQRRVGFPWSPQMVERSRRSVGGTLAACRTALAEGCAVNLAGGTHHAFADHGEGYCVFNDVAVALRALLSSGDIGRAAVLDCDVHQGNGTAAIFEDEPRALTFSIHGRKNFPFRKQRSDVDIEVEDGTGDEEYLALLEEGLTRTLAAFQGDLAVFVAGADPFRGDRLGRLALSKAGLAQRDRRIFEHCRRRSLPVAVVMAGGYAELVEDIVDIHAQTVALAAEYHRCWESPSSSHPS